MYDIYISGHRGCMRGYETQPTYGSSRSRRDLARSDDERENRYLCTTINPSHAAIKILINTTAAEFICKNIFPTPVQIKKL